MRRDAREIAEHRGRIVKNSDDGFLADFFSSAAYRFSMLHSTGIGEFGDAGEGFAEGATGDVLPDRQIEADFERAALDFVCKVAAPRLVRGGEPRLAQILDRLVGSPSRECVRRSAPGARRLRLVAGFSMS